MLSSNVTIEAMAYELAPHIVTSAEIEDQLSEPMERLGIPKGRLEQLTGIRERRFWDPGMMPSEGATLAARKLLDQTEINPDEIGVLINTSVCRDYVEPSTACLVHGNLEFPETCRNFDVSNACLGFLDGMNIAQMMIETGQVKYALIVDAESSRDGIEATIERLHSPETSLQDFFDNFASFTIGSGAVAMLLGNKNNTKTGHVINGSVSRADTRYNRLCVAPTQKEMKTDSHGLLVAGLALALRTWHAATKILPRWSDDEIDVYTPHQVSVKHTKEFCKKLELTFEKFHLNIYTQGNVAPAGLPMTLAMADEAGKIKSGNHVALMGIGSGINCTMMSVTW
jgi:3-oxoacyl-[acyl-carrier-protein] synthase-3